MPEHTRTIPREVPEGTAEGGRKHPREGIDAGYIRRRPRRKRNGDFGNPRRSGTARNHEHEPQVLVAQRDADHEEAMTPAVDAAPTVYCFRSPHLIGRTN